MATATKSKKVTNRTAQEAIIEKHRGDEQERAQLATFYRAALHRLAKDQGQDGDEEAARIAAEQLGHDFDADRADLKQYHRQQEKYFDGEFSDEKRQAIRLELERIVQEHNETKEKHEAIIEESRVKLHNAQWRDNTAGSAASQIKKVRETRSHLFESRQVATVTT